MFKKLSICSLSIIFLFALSSCSNSENKTEALVAPAGMQYVDISASGMNLNILVPDSNLGALDTIQTSFGSYHIKRGKDFQISITEDGGTTASKKEDNKNADLLQVKQYLIDEPNTLMWECGIADISEFHFFHISKIGNRTFVFENLKDESFSKEAIQKMLDACKNAKAIEKSN
jgi:hypothetical protein